MGGLLAQLLADGNYKRGLLLVKYGENVLGWWSWTEQHSVQVLGLFPVIKRTPMMAEPHLPRGLSLRWGLRERERLPSFFL